MTFGDWLVKRGYATSVDTIYEEIDEFELDVLYQIWEKE